MKMNTPANPVVVRVLIPVSCECVSVPGPHVRFCRNPGCCLVATESCSAKPGLDDPEDIVVFDSVTCDSVYDG